MLGVDRWVRRARPVALGAAVLAATLLVGAVPTALRFLLDDPPWPPSAWRAVGAVLVLVALAAWWQTHLLAVRGTDDAGPRAGSEGSAWAGRPTPVPDDVARAVRAGDPVPARWRGPARLQLTAQIALLSGVFVGLVTMVAGMLSSGLLTGRPVVELMVGLLLLPAAVVAGVLRRRLTARRRLLDTDTT